MAVPSTLACCAPSAPANNRGKVKRTMGRTIAGVNHERRSRIGAAVGKGEFRQVRKIIQDIAIIQDQQAKVLLRHSEILAEHDERMAEHDERMDRVGRHLEVLANITDSLIRDKADRKKR